MLMIDESVKFALDIVKRLVTSSLL